MKPHISQNEHGYCPKCKANFDGEPVWQYFYKQLVDGTYGVRGSVPMSPAQAELEADRIAANYGCDRDHGKFGMRMGVEENRDRIEYWMCHMCNHKFGYRDGRREAA